MELAVQGSLIRFRNATVFVPSQGAFTSPPNGTTATVSLTKSDGSVVANATNLSMTLDAGTVDSWSLTLPNSVVLTDGTLYYVTVTLTPPSLPSVPFRNKFRASYPRGNSTPA